MRWDGDRFDQGAGRQPCLHVCSGDPHFVDNETSGANQARAPTLPGLGGRSPPVRHRKGVRAHSGGGVGGVVILSNVISAGVSEASNCSGSGGSGNTVTIVP